MKKIPLSLLDLAIVVEGGNSSTAIERTVQTAQHADALGYKRIWLAEHHNMQHIASSATSVLIGHVAGKTKNIRVGSGGIMLPNHSPLVIAEQFGTLESIYPGRIDLGLGRAPGTDKLTAQALRRTNVETSWSFPTDVKQLQNYFDSKNSAAKVRSFPGEGLSIPIWILGSSTDSAYLAAEMGLPYAFASHFAPAQFKTAIAIYRSNFKPSARLKTPYVMACVNVIAADTDEEAEFELTSLLRMFTGIITNMRLPLQPPGDLPAIFHVPEVQAALNNMLSCTFSGSATKLKAELMTFISENGVDELMASTNMYDVNARMKSYTILFDVLNN